MDFMVVFTAALMLAGLIGVVVPVLPGLVVIWAGVLLWALDTGSRTGWWALGVISGVYALGVLAEYLVPGRRMRRAGVPTSTLVLAVLLAIAMGVLVPVVGAFIGFPLGIYATQRVRSGDAAQAKTATVKALQAIGLNIAIELVTALLMISTWVLALLL